MSRPRRSLAERIETDLRAVAEGGNCTHAGCALDDDTGNAECVACGIVVATGLNPSIDRCRNTLPIERASV